MSQSDSLKTALKYLELSDLAIEVYELVFSTLNPNITDIAKRLNTNRNRIYEALEELTKARLIKENDSHQRGIVPEPPQKIIARLRDKELNIKRSSEDLSKILPDLSTIYYSNKRQPYIKILEGKYQYIDAFNQVLDEAKEILYFGNSEIFYDMVGFDYHMAWSRERIKRKIPTRIITTNGPKIQTMNTIDGKTLRKVKLLPPEFSTLQGTYYLYGNKSLHWNPVLPKVIVIEDSVINSTFKANFEALWALMPEIKLEGFN
jgi:sugar-specific transcriptional regulator TrmB